MADKEDVLPRSLAARGLSRVQAAAYIGVSPTLFDEMVKDGRMPKPTRINARIVWDRIKLDEAFAALSDDDRDDDPWDKWSSDVAHGAPVITFDFEYVHRDVDRHGNVRLYFRRRKGDRKIRLRGTPGTAEFQAQYDAAKALAAGVAAEPAERATATSFKPHTYGWLSEKYMSSVEFRRLNSTTQAARRAS